MLWSTALSLWPALIYTAVAALAEAKAEAGNPIRAVAHNLQALHVKRGLPWDIGKCKPRCIEADGLWDDCLINVANLTKCFQHCYELDQLLDCLYCNQEQYHTDYHVHELRIGELCAGFLRDPTATDLSRLMGSGQPTKDVYTFGQAASSTSEAPATQRPSPIPTVPAAQVSAVTGVKGAALRLTDSSGISFMAVCAVGMAVMLI